MKKGFQWMALLVVAMLGACSGGSDKAAAEKVDEKPRVKLAEVSFRYEASYHSTTRCCLPPDVRTGC